MAEDVIVVMPHDFDLVRDRAESRDLARMTGSSDLRAARGDRVYLEKFAHLLDSLDLL